MRRCSGSLTRRRVVSAGTGWRPSVWRTCAQPFAATEDWPATAEAVTKTQTRSVCPDGSACRFVERAPLAHETLNRLVRVACVLARHSHDGAACSESGGVGGALADL